LVDDDDDDVVDDEADVDVAASSTKLCRNDNTRFV
jgi:hypothetical protein